jgi:hypothetical protein
MKKLLFLLIICCLSFSSQAQTADTTLSVSVIKKPASATSITYQWTKVSGPSAGNIVTPYQPSTKINGFVEGSYVIQCVAKGSDGTVSNPSIWRITVVNGVLIISAGQDIILKTQ